MPRQASREVEPETVMPVYSSRFKKIHRPDHMAAADHMQRVIKALYGYEDLPPGMADTPERFIRYLVEFNQPCDPAEVLGELFDVAPSMGGIHSMVVQANIPFRMVCEHHLLPALGRANVGYIPRGKVVGLSKLTRLVQAMGTSRPTLQEVVCESTADALQNVADAAGTMITIHAEHTCMACRGVNSPRVTTSTSSLRGVFRDVPAARQEFFDLVRQAKTDG